MNRVWKGWFGAILLGGFLFQGGVVADANFPGRIQERGPWQVAVSEITSGKIEYQAQGRRDPFRPLISTRPALVKPRRGGGPLQQISASELRLEGIVRSSKGYLALVEGPDGKGYTLRVGTPVGTEGGRVRRITRDRVIIEEPVIDPLGRVQIREVVLRLRATEEAAE